MSMTPQDRIAGLLWKASLGFNEGTIKDSDPAVIAKFAQLVAQECVSVVREYGIHGSEYIIEDINAAFGIVEE